MDQGHISQLCWVNYNQAFAVVFHASQVSDGEVLKNEISLPKKRALQLGLNHEILFLDVILFESRLGFDLNLDLFDISHPNPDSNSISYPKPDWNNIASKNKISWLSPNHFLETTNVNPD